MAGASNSLRLTAVVFLIGAIVFGALGLFTAVAVGTIERAHPPSGRFVEVEGGRLHLVELGAADAPAVVMLHGAAVNLGDMRMALGDRLAERYRVILIDRPGYGWSERPGGSADASPARQARLIHQALAKIGVSRAILVAHSWAGALATAYALDFPHSVAGLVLLAPVTHPWPTNAAWRNSIARTMFFEANHYATAPITGPLVTRTLALPIGKLLIWRTVVHGFAPQAPPVDYLERTGTELVLRPAQFTAHAEDMAHVREFVEDQAPKYGAIAAPTAILAGDADVVVSPEVHAKAFAAALPRAKLVMLAGIGHMVHFAARERVIEAIAEIGRLAEGGPTPRVRLVP